MSTRWFTLLFILAACRNSDKPPVETGSITDNIAEDLDGDGFSDDDCDDNNALANPSALETCDGVDNNCDGEIDEGVTSTYYADEDGDSFGDSSTSQEACEPPEGYVAVNTDCNDADPDTYPSAPERCDEIDNDCDKDIDEGVTSAYYLDDDGDGYGDIDVSIQACAPSGSYIVDGTDCDDGEAAANPGETEVCDEIDNDCDKDIDEGVTSTYYLDDDGDGYGDIDVSIQACAPSGSYIVDGTDCDDGEAAANPGETEVCDEFDNDCDKDIDEGVTSTYYLDDDGDGYGDIDVSIQACAPSGDYIVDGTDCDDGEAAANPGEAEVCDEIDNDCDKDIDEGVTSTYYLDDDGDGYGDIDVSIQACAPSGSYIVDGTDCDDGEAAANPGETEVCDEFDNDCDKDIDEGVTSTYYLDDDGDGYGDIDVSIQACAPSGDYIADSTDCDDGEAAANPGEAEVCDEIDNDCDEDIDEDDAADADTWYADSDSDGYGDPATSLSACDEPSGYVSNGDDCDDSSATTAPGAPELYDGEDNDCDGSTDEDLYNGTGGDGTLSVSGVVDLTVDSSGSRSEADAVAYVVSGISGDTVTLNEDADGIAAGDEVLLINLHGSDSAYSAVGVYEFGSVASVSGAEVTLMLDVAEVYGESSNSDLSGQAIFMQRVPNYTDVDVSSGGFLTVTPWDGERYGVLAFRASGTVTIDDGGAICVDELGYWGGETGTCLNCDAYQGESYAGAGTGNVRSSPYNESNGGDTANYGGGGALITGGGGEYGGNATSGDSWNGSSGLESSAGNTYGSADLGGLFFGSGGGGVWNGGTDTTGEDPGPGGYGGGIIIISASEIIADGADAITAYGGTATHWAAGTWTYGSGGGAGGSIYLVADELTLVVDAVMAEGGLGQSSYTRDGGDGGDGRIRLDFNTLNEDSQSTSAADAELVDTCEPDPGYDAAP